MPWERQTPADDLICLFLPCPQWLQ